MKVQKVAGKEIGIAADTPRKEGRGPSKRWRIDVSVTPVDDEGQLVHAQTNRVSTYHPPYVAKEGENQGYADGKKSPRQEYMESLPKKAIDQALQQLGFTSKLKPESKPKK